MNLNAHTLTQSEYRKALLGHLTSTQSLAFTDLSPGLFYYEDYSRKQILNIAKVSAGKRKIDAVIISSKDGELSHSGPLSIYAGERHGSFHPIDQDTVDLCLRSHRDLVVEGKENGKVIPVAVRREYPDLFVAIPPEFTTKEVRDCLSGWGRMKGPEDLERVIDQTHEDIRTHDRDAAYFVVFGYRGKEEMDKARSSLLHRLALYSWMLPLISPDGVFAY